MGTEKNTTWGREPTLCAAPSAPQLGALPKKSPVPMGMSGPGLRPPPRDRERGEKMALRLLAFSAAFARAWNCPPFVAFFASNTLAFFTAFMVSAGPAFVIAFMVSAGTAVFMASMVLAG